MVNKQKRKRLLVRFRQLFVYAVVLYVVLVIAWELVVPVGAQEPSGEWVRTGASRKAYYYIGQGSDDAVLSVGQGFSSSQILNPIRHYGYDMIGGMIWNITDRVYNSTHQERSPSAFIRVWTDDQNLAPETGGFTYYIVNQSDIGTWANYSDLLNRPITGGIGYNTRFTSISLTSPSLDPRWEYFDNSIGYSALADDINLMRILPERDNDTFAVKTLSSRDDLYYYRTYEDSIINYGNNSRAPSLEITWWMYEYLEVTPPPGLDGDDWVEEYKGFQIWENPGGFGNASDYDLNWAEGLNVSSLTETDSGSDIARNNDTMVTITTMTGPVNAWLLNDSGVANINSAIFSARINMTDVDDTGAVGFTYPHSIFGVTEQGGINGHLYGTALDGDGIYFIIGIHPDNDGRYRYHIVSKDEGNHEFVSGAGSIWFYEPQDHWVVFYWDHASKSVDYEIYNNSAMTSPYLVHEEHLLHINNPAGNYRYAHITGSAYMAGIDGRVTYQLWTGVGVNASSYSITDNNGTNISDLYDSIEPSYPTIEEARDAIDRLLGGLDPTYDILPNLGNTLIALMGIMGLIMIPGSFLLLGVSIRDGEWAQGFYYLIMFFVLGLGFVTVWLFG